MKGLAVETYQCQLLVLAPAGVLLHYAGGGFKFRDVAATFAADIWIVLHVVILPVPQLSAPDRSA